MKHKSTSVTRGQRRRNRIQKDEMKVFIQERACLFFQDSSLQAIYEIFTNRYLLTIQPIELEK